MVGLRQFSNNPPVISLPIEKIEKNGTIQIAGLPKEILGFHL